MSATHGLASTYRNARCRCPACTRANSEFHAAEKAARRARFAAGEVILPHGIYSTYANWGCRCVECKAANAESRRKRRRRVEGVSS